MEELVEFEDRDSVRIRSRFAGAGGAADGADVENSVENHRWKRISRNGKRKKNVFLGTPKRTSWNAFPCSDMIIKDLLVL